jgi:hypothetical protein
MARNKTDKYDTTPTATPATTATPRKAINKRTPDMETIRALNEALRADPVADFVFRLHWHARTLLDDTELPKAAIALEMMQSTFSAFEGGFEHKDVADGYPIEAWQKDTVEIPRAWLRVLVEGWEKYKAASTGSTIGEALGIEGGGQGKQSTRERLRKLKRSIQLMICVQIEYFAERVERGRGSWERAMIVVAENEGVSEDTVKRACKKLLESSLSRADYLQLFKQKGGKAS